MGKDPIVENVSKEEEITTPKEPVETKEGDSKSEFENMLKSNKAFQSEFDRRVSQAIETAKGKWQTEYDAKISEFNTAKEKSDSEFQTKIADYEKRIGEHENASKTYQSKILSYEKGVKKESIDDVISLASKYVTDETPLEKALDIVLEKYPMFTSNSAPVNRVGKDVEKGYSGAKTPAEEYLEKTRGKKI